MYYAQNFFYIAVNTAKNYQFKINDIHCMISDLFQPVLHDWCNKGYGMCYPVFWDPCC